MTNPYQTLVLPGVDVVYAGLTPVEQALLRTWGVSEANALRVAALGAFSNSARETNAARVILQRAYESGLRPLLASRTPPPPSVLRERVTGREGLVAVDYNLQLAQNTADSALVAISKKIDLQPPYVYVLEVYLRSDTARDRVYAVAAMLVLYAQEAGQ